jgi:dihydroflavonol-4-reductase
MSSAVRTLVTGATGFIGHYVLAELLRAGVRCVALIRDADAGRLHRLLTEAAPDMRLTPDRLITIQGELPEKLPQIPGGAVDRVVHIAGSTSFLASGAEPQRTNVEGTRRLLAWMDGNSIFDLTHVSTAYVCGAERDRVFERRESTPPSFHNDYERSKWHAEQLVADWGLVPGRRVVVARPSIVTGEFRTGRATEFRGFYLLARAVEQLARCHDDLPPGARHRIQLRMRGFADALNPLVSVDWVARAVAHLALDAAAEGIYHLTHPCPPTNGQVKLWLEQYFDVGGGEFVGDYAPPASDQSAAERAFNWGTQPLATYFADAPAFDCSRATAALNAHRIVCPRIDRAYVARCISYAQARRWGRAESNGDDAERVGAAYFERFLPAHLPQSLVSRITSLRTTMRFVIEGQEWVCHFDGGRLRDVRRGPNGLVEQFGYRTTTAGFWRAVSGDVDGEQLFAAGEADVFGDVEAALKMSAILREFTREFPCDRARLAPFMERA